MKYIDLHVHSNISDGTLSPKEVVLLAAKSNLSAIALTDHDTVAGIEEAKKAAMELKKEGKDIRIVEGVEISADYKGKDIHILGLLIDTHHKGLIQSLENAIQNRDARNEKMASNLRAAGIPITLEALSSHEPDTVITRAHFARYLFEHNYVKTMNEAFELYLGEHCPYYVAREYITPKEAISIIKEAGGIPVLAHPLLYKYSMKELEELILQLKDFGLVGIETIYSANSGSDESLIKELAKRYDLLMTGGSDYHGSNKPHIAIGIGKGNLKIPYTMLDTLDQYKKIHF